VAGRGGGGAPAARGVPDLQRGDRRDGGEPGREGTTRSEQIAVAHADPSKVELARDLGRRYPPDPDATSGVPHVLRTGRSELYPEIPRELLDRAAVDDEHRRLIAELDLRSAMVVPLRGQGAVLGAITFAFSGARRRYTEEDLAFAEELARRAALILERRKAEEEAAIANRMKDEFLATLSHELRTPLQAILGYATMLERGTIREPEKALAAIVRNATAQTRLVEDMLDVARIASGKLQLVIERVDLAAAIRGALDAVRPAAAARGVELVERIAADLGTVAGDFERLQQVAWNLLANAVKFTEPGGTVTIEAECTGSSVRFRVIDTGRGIAPEHLGAVFERFRQVDGSTTRTHGGLGLGLAIVRYLVEAHGGTVEARSEGLGRGATFEVALPARIAAIAPQGTPVRTAGGDLPLRGIRVLVVEDDDDARAVVGEALAAAGARVELAASAAAGFGLLCAEPPHVLVSDIGMASEDGYALLRRIRALAPEKGGDVPAIALTAYARPADVRQAEKAGFQLHVKKPVQLEVLVNAVLACVKSG
jgi:signal transduction histidine kinase